MTTSTYKPKAKRNAATPPSTAALPTLTDKSRQLQVKETPGKTRDRLLTDIVSQGMLSNASTTMRFVTVDFGDLSLTDMVASLREQGEAVNRGEFAAAERMLHSQAVALNAMFAELARRAASNMGEHLTATETYLRLALKTQGQCRATLETLCAMKNPPVMFARQANINNGGQQQVNNGGASAHPTSTSHETRTTSEPGPITSPRRPLALGESAQVGIRADDSAGEAPGQEGCDPHQGRGSALD